MRHFITFVLLYLLEASHRPCSHSRGEDYASHEYTEVEVIGAILESVCLRRICLPQKARRKAFFEYKRIEHQKLIGYLYTWQRKIPFESDSGILCIVLWLSYLTNEHNIYQSVQQIRPIKYSSTCPINACLNKGRK